MGLLLSNGRRQHPCLAVFRSISDIEGAGDVFGTDAPLFLIVSRNLRTSWDTLLDSMSGREAGARTSAPRFIKRRIPLEVRTSQSP